MDRFTNPDRATIVVALKLAQCLMLGQPIKVTPVHQAFIDHGIGRRDARGHYRMTKDDRFALMRWLEYHGVDWTTHPRAYRGTAREQDAIHELADALRPRKETGRLPVVPLDDRVSLQGEEPYVPPNSAHLSIDPGKTFVKKLSGIVVIENLAGLRLADRLAAPLQRFPPGWLGVFRGKNQSGETWAHEVGEKHRVPVLGFFDFDPPGLSMGLKGEFDGLILPKHEDIPAMTNGNTVKPWDYAKQHEEWQTLYMDLVARKQLSPWLMALSQLRMGILQEAMVTRWRNLGLTHQALTQ